MGHGDEHQYLTLRELQMAMLEMAIHIDAFCKSHAIAYSLSSGTLLGAVREGGFIPWDDDLDLSMARPDYDRLVSLADEFHEETGLVLEGHAELAPEDAAFLKIRHPSIAVRSEFEARDGSAWVDIFPADGLPEDDEKLASHYRKAHFYQQVLAGLQRSPRKGESLRKRLAIRLLRPFGHLYAVRAHYARKLNELGRSVPYGSTPYVGHLTWGIAGPAERVPHEGYDNKVDMPFEDVSLSAMSCYSTYLQSVYGLGYMTPAPPGKRHDHRLIAWYTGEENGDAL